MSSTMGCSSVTMFQPGLSSTVWVDLGTTAACRNALAKRTTARATQFFREIFIVMDENETWELFNRTDTGRQT